MLSLLEIFCPLCKSNLNRPYKNIYSLYTKACECESTLADEFVLKTEVLGIDIKYKFDIYKPKLSNIEVNINFGNDKSYLSFPKLIKFGNEFEIDFDPRNKTIEELIKISTKVYNLQILC